MNRKILIWAAIFNLLAVILGAFGAHSIKKIITADMLSIWQTGIQYQFYHALGLLFLSGLKDISPKFTKITFVCFFCGILLFSGSLYLLALKEFLNAPWLKYLGPITPLGGGFFIVGWLSLLFGAFKISK